MNAPRRPHPSICRHCKGLAARPTRRAHRRLPRPFPCHHALVIGRLSWNALVHYGVIDRVPVDELTRVGATPFSLVGSTPVVPRVLNERLRPDAPRWKYA